MSFADLGLNAQSMRAIKALGYTSPTPIQVKAIPVALAGRDLIGIAETGSGKTASYLIPIIQRLRGGSGLRALIIAPTRELALQIEAVANDLATGTDLRTVALIGGVRASEQLRRLQRGVDIVVATPGRLLDHARSGLVRLNGIKELVLDEGDRLLDMGFLPDVRSILQKLPRDRHSMLFSATFSREIEVLAFEFMRDQETIELGRRATPVLSVDQMAYSIMSHHKTPLLLRLADKEIDGQALIFTRTKRGADNLANVLKIHGHAVDVMHADRAQTQRIKALDRFKSGKVKLLVATDIAARGIDVEDVAFVINYDIPATADDYVHRIGRTARAGRKGTAITFVSPAEEVSLKDIEHTTGQSISRARLENFSDGRPQDAVTAFLATVQGTVGRTSRSFGRRGGRRRIA
jgi:ATP-dependent RNA helicase RhlE